MHHKWTGGRISNLAGSGNSSELVFPSLFILFALLEEGLRDFDVLHDQQMSFWSCACGRVIFTVALGTLGRTAEHQHFVSRSGHCRETYVVDGAIMNTDLASCNERP